AGLGGLGRLGQRYPWLGPQRGERPIARLGGRMTFVFPLPPRGASPLRPQPSGGALMRLSGGSDRSSGASTAPRTAAVMLLSSWRPTTLETISARAGSMGRNLLRRERAR